MSNRRFGNVAFFRVQNYQAQTVHGECRRRSVRSLNLLPRSTLTLNIHGLLNGQTFVSGPRDNRMSTYVQYYKDTDNHSYLNFSSSHLSCCKSSIPCSQFLRLHKICSGDDDFDTEATTMEKFFAARGYPNDIIRRGRERVSTKSRAEILKSNAGNNTANDRLPFVTIFHPMNLDACKIISRNFRILRDDSTTGNIFDKPPLKAFMRAKNLKDLAVRSSLPRNLPNQPTGTFPCNKTVCRTCPHVNSSATFTTPKGHVNITGHFSRCITDKV